jgi:hypothetical protein
MSIGAAMVAVSKNGWIAVGSPCGPMSIVLIQPRVQSPTNSRPS